jgi:hypothetical protein
MSSEWHLKYKYPQKSGLMALYANVLNEMGK